MCIYSNSTNLNATICVHILSLRRYWKRVSFWWICVGAVLNSYWTKSLPPNNKYISHWGESFNCSLFKGIPIMNLYKPSLTQNHPQLCGCLSLKQRHYRWNELQRCEVIYQSPTVNCYKGFNRLPLYELIIYFQLLWDLIRNKLVMYYRILSALSSPIKPFTVDSYTFSFWRFGNILVIDIMAMWCSPVTMG